MNLGMFVTTDMHSNVKRGFKQFEHQLLPYDLLREEHKQVEDDKAQVN